MLWPTLRSLSKSCWPSHLDHALTVEYSLIETVCDWQFIPKRLHFCLFPLAKVLNPSPVASYMKAVNAIEARYFPKPGHMPALTYHVPILSLDIHL